MLQELNTVDFGEQSAGFCGVVRQGQTTTEIPVECLSMIAELRMGETLGYGQVVIGEIEHVVDTKSSDIQDFDILIQGQTGNFSVVSRAAKGESTITTGVYNRETHKYTVMEMGNIGIEDEDSIESVRKLTWSETEPVFAFTFVYRDENRFAQPGVGIIRLTDDKVFIKKILFRNNEHVSNLQPFELTQNGETVVRFVAEVVQSNGESGLMVWDMEQMPEMPGDQEDNAPAPMRDHIRA